MSTEEAWLSAEADLKRVTAERDALRAQLTDAREWTVIGYAAWPGNAPTWRDRTHAERFITEYPHPLAYIARRLRTEWTRDPGVGDRP